MKKVLVLSTINGLAGRSCLTGIFRYVNSGLDWSIRFIERPDEGGASVLDSLRSGEVDGVIVSLDRQTELLPHILRARLPVVMIHDKTGIAPHMRRNFVLVRNDDIAVGRLAARHLLERGRFASFVYLPTENRTSWSIFRERGFRLELGRHGVVPRRWRRARESLAELLRDLPQPVAMMGATDLEAMAAIDVCRAHRIPVPARAAVVSVDNDEILCESTQPTLSSIRTDDGLVGELAARALDGLMRSRKSAPAREILVPPTEVVERNSTRSVPPAGHLIQDALRYIHANVTKGLTVADVVHHLHVSPSLARKRFQEVAGKSIRDTILDARLALAERKLLATSEPIARIAKSCGFASPCRMAHFFAERRGLSPSEFRNRRGMVPPVVRLRRKRR